MMISAPLVPMSTKLDAPAAGNNGQEEASPAKRLRRSPAPEPTSVLYKRSPSPPTSSEPPPPISAEDWEAVLGTVSPGGDMAAPPSATHYSHDATFLRWVMGMGGADGPQIDAFFDPCFLQPPWQQQQQQQDEAAFFQPPHPQPPLPALPPLPLPVLPAEEEDKGNLVDPRGGGGRAPGGAAPRRRRAAGDTTGAREILARLNHRLLRLRVRVPAPPPLLRAAALLRDALQLRLLPVPAAHPPPTASPIDLALINKLAAHKALADASPAVHFASLTSTQALLDALGAARRVHVVDLDVGFGARWPPLMQELALQWRRLTPPASSSSASPSPSIKITALVSPGPGPGSASAAHPLELHLTHHSLARFAADLGIAFEFTALEFDPYGGDPIPPVGLSVAPGEEAVAVHLTIGSAPSPALTTTLLRVVRQLRPAIVVCVDHGCHRGDLPLPHHALNVVTSTAAFLESLDAAGAPADAVAKVEQYVLRPTVERLMCLAAGESGTPRMPPWQSMFVSAGFAPVQLSNAAEMQAECLVRRTPTPGFHVHKRQAALALRWHQSDLLTVSAWRCAAQQQAE